jgi:AcrR family transcriptional regulator
MIVHSFYSWVVTILLGQKLCKQLKLFENQDISMVAATKKTVPKRRTESKEKRRLQLIKATIRTIAKRGLSDTTMATVAGDANLSQGIINLHFQSKDRLLVETLRYVADDYRNAWTNALQKTGPDSAETAIETKLLSGSLFGERANHGRRIEKSVPSVTRNTVTCCSTSALTSRVRGPTPMSTLKQLRLDYRR